VRSSAIISPCGKYRYSLTRELRETGGRKAAIIMVNPSTADADKDDPTIRRLLGFAELAANDWRQITVANLFAYRATDIKELRSLNYADAVGPENDQTLEQIMTMANVVVVGWGPTSKLPPHLRNRWHDIRQLATEADAGLFCWGVAKDGHPRHPLFVPYSEPLQRWPRVLP
jgi:hypothetical protein